MSLNAAHAGKGVLIYSGEVIILFCDHVTIEFGGSLPAQMKGKKTGRLYLTTHRIIFNNKENKDALQSFASPFFCLHQVTVEQPVFGANYLQGFVKAQPDGGFNGEAKFKMTFKHGGAIEFGQALLKVASMARRNVNPTWSDAPPPYMPPTAPWAAAPPPAYAPPQSGYYGWVPPVNTFPDRPPTDGVYMYEAPPPYPGLGFTNPNGPPQPAAPASAPPPHVPNQNAFYDPSQPQYAYVPPPAYSATPYNSYPAQAPPSYEPTAPNFDDVQKKKQ